MKASRPCRIVSYIPAGRSARKSTVRLRDFRGACHAIGGRTTRRCLALRFSFKEENREPVTKGDWSQPPVRSSRNSFYLMKILVDYSVKFPILTYLLKRLRRHLRIPYFANSVCQFGCASRNRVFIPICYVGNIPIEN